MAPWSDSSPDESKASKTRQNKVIHITRIARLRQTRKHSAAAAAAATAAAGIAALLLQALGQAAGRGLVQGERADFTKDRQGIKKNDAPDAQKART